MPLTQKFRDDNPDENVDSKISELAAHNSNLEKKLDFSAKQIRKGSGDKEKYNTKTIQANISRRGEGATFLLNEVDDLETEFSDFKQEWRKEKCKIVTGKPALRIKTLVLSPTYHLCFSVILEVYKTQLF